MTFWVSEWWLLVMTRLRPFLATKLTEYGSMFNTILSLHSEFKIVIILEPIHFLYMTDSSVISLCIIYYKHMTYYIVLSE